MGAVGAYLLSGGLISSLSRITPLQTAEQLTVFNASLQEWRGYFKFITRFRNLVIAHKYQSVLRHLQRELKEDRPVIVAPIGPLHVKGLKEALAMDPVIRERFIQELVVEAEKLAPESSQEIRALLTTVPVAVSNKDLKWEGKIIHAPFTKRE